MPKLSQEEWNKLVQADEARKATRRERIRQGVAKGPAPLSQALRDALLQLLSVDVRAIMVEHPGFALFEKRASYRTSRTILDTSVSDLLAAIDAFSARALAEQSDLFSNPYSEGELKVFEQRIQKELFTAANGAASLVDHSRVIRDTLALTDYPQHLRRGFGADGLHEFVIALRVLLHHVHVVEAGWHLHYDFDAQTKQATFVIDKEVLLRVIAQHDLSKKALLLKFVEQQAEYLDIRILFAEYQKRVDLFHDWLVEQLQADARVALHDYDYIMQEKENRDTRQWWSAMLGNWLRNWKKPPNPHSHLPKYLTPDQLARVYALPRNSKAQVDLVIEFIDKGHAIDDQLRILAYELFERSSQPGNDLEAAD
jgi:hypothetical protein